MTEILVKTDVAKMHLEKKKRILLTWRGAAICPRAAATLLSGTMSSVAPILEEAPLTSNSGTMPSPSSDEPPLTMSLPLHDSQIFS